MNYSFPYYFSPMVAPVAKTGLKGLVGGIKWGSIINGTQKALGLINQSLPLIKQAKPLLSNAKTMYRVMNEFKKFDTPNTSSTGSVSETKTTNFENNSGPTFFA